MQPESLDSEVGMQCSQGHWTVRWGCSVAWVIGQGGGDDLLLCVRHEWLSSDNSRS